MGNDNSKNCADDVTKKYRELAKLATVMNGGCPCANMYHGSADEINLEKEAIEDFIRGMYTALKRIFNLPDTNNVDEMHTAIQVKIPDLMEFKNNKALLETKKEKLDSVAKILKEQVNKLTKEDKITSNDTIDIYKELGEFVYNLGKILTVKLLKLKDNIIREEKKYHDFSVMIDSLFATLKQPVTNEEKNFIILYISEFEKQRKIVSTYLFNTLNKDLHITDEEVIFKPNSDYNSLLEQLKATSNNALPDINLNATSVLIACKESVRRMYKYLKYLRALGITLEEYATISTDFQKFRLTIAEKARDLVISKKVLSDSDLTKMTEALNNLNNIEPYPVDELYKVRKEIEGSAEENYNPLESKSTQIILNAFVQKLVYILDQLSKKIKEMTKMIPQMRNVSIDVFKDIYRFLDRLPSFDNINVLFKILSGICEDVASKQTKILFTTTLKDVVSKFSVLVQNNPDIAIMSEIRDLFNNLLQTIDGFTGQIKTTKIGGDDVTLINNVSINLTAELDMLKHQIIYYIKLISLLTSLHNEASIVKHYVKRSQEVDGRWVAEYRDKLNNELNQHLKTITDTKMSIGGQQTSTNYKYNTEALTLLEKSLNSIKNAKDKLWITGESFNEYLKILHENIRDDPQKNVETLSHILHYVDVANMISSSGKGALWTLMESFPGISDGYTQYISKLATITPDVIEKKHYYVILAISNEYADFASLNADCPGYITQDFFNTIKTTYNHTIPNKIFDKGLPGNPLIPLPVITVESKDKKRNNLKEVQKLLTTILLDPLFKNLFSFVFGLGVNEQNAKQNSFMSPREMYRNIIEYIKVTSVVPCMGIPMQTYNTTNNIIEQPETAVTDKYSYHDNKFIWGNMYGTKFDCESIKVCFNADGQKLFNPSIVSTSNIFPEVQYLSNICMRPVSSFMNKAGTITTMFGSTDDLLVKIIQASFTKVISSIRLITSLSETYHDENLTYNSNMRRIIGAAEEAMEFNESTVFSDKFVKVLARLPLLIELMIHIYKFTDGHDYDYIVTPLLEDEFYYLFELIRKSLTIYFYGTKKIVKISDDIDCDVAITGGYPPDICDAIIKEVYKIVKAHPDDDDVNIVVKAHQSFAKRITMVSQNYIKEYLESLRGECKDIKLGTESSSFGEIMLRPVDGSTGKSGLLTPSHQYMKSAGIAALFTPKDENDAKISKLTLTEHYDIIQNICNRFKEYIQTNAPTLDDQIDFTLDNFISNAILEKNNSKTLHEKILGFRKILNEGNMQTISNMVILIGYNETVISQLYHLYAVYNFLNGMLGKISSMASAIDLLNDNGKTLKDIIDDRSLFANEYKRDYNSIISEFYEYNRYDVNWFEDAPAGAINPGIDGIYYSGDPRRRGLDELSLPIRAAMPDNINQLPVMWQDMKKLIQINIDNGDKDLEKYMREVFNRYVLDDRRMFTDLFEIIQSFQTFNGYTNVTITNNNFVINVNNLRTDIIGLFNDLSGYNALFSPYINKKIYEQFMDKTNVGSYYWLEENLLNKIILDKKNDNKWLAELDCNVQKIINYLKHPWKANSRVIHYPITTAGIAGTSTAVGTMFRPSDANIIGNANVDSMEDGAMRRMQYTILIPCPGYDYMANDEGKITLSLSAGYIVDTETITITQGQLNYIKEASALQDVPNRDIILPTHEIRPHTIGFPLHYRTLMGRDPKNPFNPNNNTISSYPTNYFPQIMKLLYLPLNPVNFIPSNHMHRNLEPDAFRVKDLNHLFGFIVNKGSKDFMTVRPGQSLIPNTVIQTELNELIGYYHGNNSFSSRSNRSIIVMFNQLLGLFIENIIQIPFNKIFNELIIPITNIMAPEIGDYKNNLKDILSYTKYMHAQLDNINATYARLAGDNTYYNMLSTDGIDGKHFGMMLLYNRIVNVIDTDYYTEPLINNYWNNSVLCESISAALYQIQNSKTNNEKLIYIESDINELTSYYKDKLKTALIIIKPYLISLLTRTKLFIEYIKPFTYFQRMEHYGYSTDIDMGLGIYRNNDRQTTDQIKNMINVRCNNIIKYTETIISSINKTLLIFHDKPILGELVVGCNPLNTAIFPSFLSTLYCETNIWDENTFPNDSVFIPQYNTNDAKHKIQCALRYFFNTISSGNDKNYCTPILMNVDSSGVTYDLSGTLMEQEMKNISSIIPRLNNWKTVVNRGIRIALFNIDKSKINRLFVRTNTNDLYISLVNVGDDPLYKTNLLDGLDDKMKFPILNYSCDEIISILENNTLNDQYKKLFSYLGKNMNILFDRNNMRVMNLIDTSIMPVAAHSFSNDSPFVMILYYAAMFPSLITEMTSEVYNKHYLGKKKTTPFKGLNTGAIFNIVGACECFTGDCDNCRNQIAVHEGGDPAVANSTDFMKLLLMDPFCAIDYESYLTWYPEFIGGYITNIDLFKSPRAIDLEISNAILIDHVSSSLLEHATKSPTSTSRYLFNDYADICYDMIKFAFNNSNKYLMFTPYDQYFSIHGEGTGDDEYRKYVCDFLFNCLFGDRKHDGIYNDDIDVDEVPDDRYVKHSELKGILDDREFGFKDDLFDIRDKLAKLDVKTDRTQATVDAIQKRVDKLEGSIDSFITNLAKLETSNKELQDKYNTLSTTARTISDDETKKIYDTITKKINKVSAETQELIDGERKWAASQLTELWTTVNDCCDKTDDILNVKLPELEIKIENNKISAAINAGALNKLQSTVIKFNKLVTNFMNNADIDTIKQDLKDYKDKVADFEKTLNELKARKLPTPPIGPSGITTGWTNERLFAMLFEIANTHRAALEDIYHILKVFGSKFTPKINRYVHLLSTPKNFTTAYVDITKDKDINNPKLSPDAYIAIKNQIRKEGEVNIPPFTLAALRRYETEHPTNIIGVPVPSSSAYLHGHSPAGRKTAGDESSTGKKSHKEELYPPFSKLPPKNALIYKLFALYPNNISYKKIVTLINSILGNRIFTKICYSQYVYVYYWNLVMHCVNSAILCMDQIVQDDLIKVLNKHTSDLHNTMVDYLKLIIFNSVNEADCYLLGSNQMYKNNIVTQLQKGGILNYFSFKIWINLIVAYSPRIIPNDIFNRFPPIITNQPLYNHWVPMYIVEQKLYDKYDKNMSNLYKHINADNSLRYVPSYTYSTYLNTHDDLFDIYNDNLYELATEYYNNNHTNIASPFRPPPDPTKFILRGIPEYHIPVRINPYCINDPSLIGGDNKNILNKTNSFNVFSRLYLIQNMALPFIYDIDRIAYNKSKDVSISYKFPVDSSKINSYHFRNSDVYIDQSNNLHNGNEMILDMRSYDDLKFNDFVYMCLASTDISFIVTTSTKSTKSPKLDNIMKYNKGDVINTGFGNVTLKENTYTFNDKYDNAIIDTTMNNRQLFSINIQYTSSCKSNLNITKILDDSVLDKIVDINTIIKATNEISYKNIPDFENKFGKQFKEKFEVKTGGMPPDDTIYFYDDSDKLRGITVGENIKSKLNEIGYIRFNTFLIRLMIAAQCCVRFIVMEIKNAITNRQAEKVKSGLALADMDLTEEDLTFNME